MDYFFYRTIHCSKRQSPAPQHCVTTLRSGLRNIRRCSSMILRWLSCISEWTRESLTQSRWSEKYGGILSPKVRWTVFCELKSLRKPSFEKGHRATATGFAIRLNVGTRRNSARSKQKYRG